MSAQSETTQNDADQYDDGDGTDFDEPTGPPYRAIAMVLLAAVVLAIGIGLVQLFGGDDDEATPAADDQSTSQPQDPAADQQGQSGPEGQPGADGTLPGQPGSGSGEGPQTGGEQAGGEQAGGGDAPAPDGQPGQAGQQGQQGQEAAQGNVPPVTSVPVQVFNNSNVTGLAGRTGEQLRETGFAVGEVANLPSSQGVIPESAAYYGSGPGQQQAAQAIADQLGIPAKPRPADFAADAGGVVVIVTQDLAG